MKNNLCALIVITAVVTTSLFGMEQEQKQQEQKKWQGERYAQNSAIQFNAGKGLVSKIQFGGDEIVLDLCCGTAQLAAYMAKEIVPHGHVTAVDFSESMVKKATEQYGQITNLTIMQGDATTLNFNEQFDMVISVYGLHWIPDIEGIKAVMDGVERSLKPGGTFFAIVTILHSDQHPNPVMEFVQSLIRSEKWASYYEGKMPLGNSLSIEDYQEAMDDAGLQGTASIEVIPSRPFTKEQMGGFLSALPILQDLPEGKRGDFVNDLFAGFESLKNEEGLYLIGNISGVIKAISH